MSELSIESKFNFAYKLANKISDSIDLPNGENYQNEYFWIWRDGYEDEVENMIVENPEIIQKPQKHTLLHHYIQTFYCAYFEHKKYWFLDDFYNWEEEEIQGFFFNDYLRHQHIYNDQTIQEIENNSKFSTKHIRTVLKSEQTEQNKLIHEMFEIVEDQVFQDEIVELVTDETFGLLFVNKNFLFNFSLKISKKVNQLLKDGKIKNLIQREEYFPEWLKRSVFFRDQGKCQICKRPLDGTIALLQDREQHYDHIIPLEKGGTNEPTNFQILCNGCNLSKGTKIVKPKFNFTLYWER